MIISAFGDSKAAVLGVDGGTKNEMLASGQDGTEGLLPYLNFPTPPGSCNLMWVLERPATYPICGRRLFCMHLAQRH